MPAILHLIQTNFDQISILKTFNQIVTPLDHIVFLQDGVYLTQMLTAQENYFLDRLNCQNLFAIESDLLARGLFDLKNLRIKTIDYLELVDLFLKYPTIQQWAN